MRDGLLGVNMKHTTRARFRIGPHGRTVQPRKLKISPVIIVPVKVRHTVKSQKYVRVLLHSELITINFSLAGQSTG